MNNLSKGQIEEIRERIKPLFAEKIEFLDIQMDRILSELYDIAYGEGKEEGEEIGFEKGFAESSDA